MSGVSPRGLQVALWLLTVAAVLFVAVVFGLGVTQSLEDAPVAEPDKPTRCFDRTYGSIPDEGYIECPHREHKLLGRHCICQRLKEKWIYDPVRMRCHWEMGSANWDKSNQPLVERPDGGGIIVRCPP